MTARARIRLLVAGACLAAAAVVVLRFSPAWILLRKNPGSFDRDRMEAIVAEARSLDVAANDIHELRLDDFSDPGALRARGPDEGRARGTGAGNVWVRRSADGGLTVVIETRDLGHAGEYGFAYCDTPPTATTLGAGWMVLDVPGRLHLVKEGMRIDEHWWEVVYNLD